MTLHDMNGNGTVADDGGGVPDRRDVRLYLDDGDGVIDGGDALTRRPRAARRHLQLRLGWPTRTYYVAIDSRTLPTPAQSIWAEQTYGVAGAAQGAGFLGGPAALFGGRDALSPMMSRP